ncbi:MAG: adenine phosphoribosyltransferase [Sphingobacteriales bacterium]|nr:adenine phosphoribosyltransferase [Sphingobacteriales bacterium]
MIETALKHAIRDIVDFPKPGIVFKDITPILKDAELCREVLAAFVAEVQTLDIDVVVGIESRGFLFGMLLANALDVPFVPIRKQGKLPYKTLSQSYDLEYGSATLEIHADALQPGQKVLIHDDLLATGGTVAAAANLVEQLGASTSAFAFVVSLDFLDGKSKLVTYSNTCISLVNY